MKRAILVLCLGMLGGCAVVPETITKQPATVIQRHKSPPAGMAPFIMQEHTGRCLLTGIR